MSRGRASRAAWIAVRGVISGFLYYLVYVIALPLLATAAGTQQAPAPPFASKEYLAYLAVLTALGAGAALARGTPAALPLNILTSIVSWLLAYTLLTGGILHGSLGDTTVTVDIRPLLYAALILGLLYSTASGLESMTTNQ